MAMQAVIYHAKMVLAAIVVSLGVVFLYREPSPPRWVP